MERMMKVQDVLLKAMAKKITWWSAAEILGVTDRTMRRWHERLEKGGYAGLADRRKGRVSAKRIPLATVEKVLGLYKETYYDIRSCLPYGFAALFLSSCSMYISCF
jgi:transposase